MHYVVKLCMKCDTNVSPPLGDMRALNQALEDTRAVGVEMGLHVYELRGVALVSDDEHKCVYAYIAVPEALEPHFDKRIKDAEIALDAVEQTIIDNLIKKRHENN